MTQNITIKFRLGALVGLVLMRQEKITEGELFDTGQELLSHILPPTASVSELEKPEKIAIALDWMTHTNPEIPLIEKMVSMMNINAHEREPVPGKTGLMNIRAAGDISAEDIDRLKNMMRTHMGTVMNTELFTHPMTDGDFHKIQLKLKLLPAPRVVVQNVPPAPHADMDALETKELQAIPEFTGHPEKDKVRQAVRAMLATAKALGIHVQDGQLSWDKESQRLLLNLPAGQVKNMTGILQRMHATCEVTRNTDLPPAHRERWRIPKNDVDRSDTTMRIDVNPAILNREESVGIADRIMQAWNTDALGRA